MSGQISVNPLPFCFYPTAISRCCSLGLCSLLWASDAPEVHRHHRAPNRPDFIPRVSSLQSRGVGQSMQPGLKAPLRATLASEDRHITHWGPFVSVHGTHESSEPEDGAVAPRPPCIRIKFCVCGYQTKTGKKFSLHIA